MSKIKEATAKVIAYPKQSGANIVNAESENKIRPDYHPGYEGQRCRIYLVKENTRITEAITITEPVAAYNLVKEELMHSDREMMLSILLNAQSRLIGIETVCIGSAYCCILTPAEVFKGALLANAVSIILCHNHPSGSLKPSNEDLKITELMKDAGKLMGIKLLDHIIVSDEGYRSLCN